MKKNKNKNELMSIQKFFYNVEVSARYTLYKVKRSIYCIEEINFRQAERRILRGFFLHRNLKKSLKKVVEQLETARNATYVFNNAHPKKRAVEKLFYSI